MLRFACPQCQATIKVDDKLAGKKGKCPGCAGALQIPVSTTASQVNTISSPDNAAVTAASTPTLPPGHEFLAPPQGADELGRLGPYRILKVLGAGGMGVVYQAEDPALKRHVALKVMRPELARDVTARQRFLREGQAMARLNHDNIVTVYFVGEERGAAYLAMQFLEGQSLADRLDACPVPLADAVRIGQEIADGLAAAHERGLTHRDIKPANIWLEAPRGRVKLLDFGLVHVEENSEKLTRTGTVAGTPAYMAPEQAAGEEVDRRCDLFSLGAVLYHLLAGAAPFRGPNVLAVLQKVIHQEPKPLDEVAPETPRALVRLVARLMAKDRAERPASARDVAEKLAELASGFTSGKLPRTVPQPKQPATKKQKTENEVEETTKSVGRKKRTRLPREKSHVFLWSAIIVVGALALASYLAGPTVYLYASNQGVVSTPKLDPKVIVLIFDGDREVGRLGGSYGTWIALRAGTYRLKLGPDVEGIELVDTTLRVTRAGRLVLEVKPVQKTTPPVPVQPTPEEKPSYLSPLALVARPAQLPGVQTWTVETRTHRGAVESLATQPKGSLLASAGADGTIRVWEPGGKLVKALIGNTASVLTLAWSPDGKYLAAGCQDASATVWELATGKVLARLEGHQRAVKAILWEPTGTRLATCGTDGLILLWDPLQGRQLRTLHHNKGRIEAADWSRDGKWLATTTINQGTLLWRVDGDAEPRTLKDAAALTMCLAFSPDSKWLVTGGDDKIVRRWNVETGDALPELTGHTTRITNIAWSPDGNRIASVGWEQKVRLWDAQAGKASGPPRPIPDRPYAITWSAGSDHLLVGSGADIYDWDENAGGAPTITKGTWVWNENPAWAPDGSAVAFTYAAGDARVGIWERSTGRLRCDLDSKGTRFLTLNWSPDGTTLATGHWDSKIRLWNPTTGKLVKEFIVGQAGKLGMLTWAPDSKRLALWHDDRGLALEIWTRDGLKIRSYPLQMAWGPICGIAWSSDGKSLAASLGDGGLRLYNPDNDAAPRTLPVAVVSSGACGLAWSEDGARIAVGGTGALAIVAVQSGQVEYRSIEQHGEISVGWLADKKTLLSVGGDDTVRLWDASTKTPGRTRSSGGSFGTLSATLRYSCTFAYGGLGTSRIWDVTAGKPLWTLAPLPADGYTIVTREGRTTVSPPAASANLVYVIATERGQETLTAAEFVKRFNWKN